jgi:hypothetical protein
MGGTGTSREIFSSSDLRQRVPRKNVGRNKSPERQCRGCGATIPAQLPGPGRPRIFCTRRCRRDFYHRQEQAEVERERREAEERRQREMDEHFYGKREAARRAKWRAQNRVLLVG